MTSMKLTIDEIPVVTSGKGIFGHGSWHISLWPLLLVVIMLRSIVLGNFQFSFPQVPVHLLGKNMDAQSKVIFVRASP